MHDLRLSYTHTSRTLPFFKKKSEQKTIALQVAATWNELSATQLLAIMRIQFSYQPGPFRKLLQLQALLQLKWSLLHQFTSVQKIELFKLLELLEQNTLTNQLLPVLKVKRKALHGPSSRFRNLTFSEFIYADTLFSYYIKYEKEEYLDKLIACLYRPKRKNYQPEAADFKGDIRQDFNEHLIEQRLPLVAQLPAYTKYAILTWYRGCRKELEAIYDKVFTESNQQTASEGDWGDVLLHMAGSKFGHLEQTASQRVHTVFKEMQRQAKEHAEIERRQKQQ